ncbi:MAG: SDR family NAD(P)-dependent oxidoreductase [Actinobacteria bacterium]|nr:SDR family NAD(P)-dependent oxidoreductase [Actinomycetota bacterium]
MSRHAQDESVRRVALVTGANRGLGEAIARGLVTRGLEVVIGSRSVAAGEATAAALGDSAWAVSLDVTSAASVAAALAIVTERAGRIDVLVNNAAAHPDFGVPPSTVTDADVQIALETNLIGPWRICRGVVAAMRQQRYGRIVNVSTRSGTFSATWSNAPAYGVSKAALNMFTLQFANELRGTGVLVNACCPGVVRTRMGGPTAELSPDEGADTPIWLATLDDGGPTGQMFADRTAIEW